MVTLDDQSIISSDSTFSPITVSPNDDHRRFPSQSISP